MGEKVLEKRNHLLTRKNSQRILQMKKPTMATTTRTTFQCQKKSAVTNGNAGENTNNAKTTVKSNKENDLSKNDQIHNKPKKQKQYPATVSVFVGKIPRGTRVKELKEVIIAKGVKPVNILWKGGKGYALIYCEKKDVPSSEEL